eukprot:TRINITY_DN9413_c0_g1_i1.p1 TRINITY_DN9413_c0_g1~~TRINITY_DN9413_c0_g1_i1.p1  ORF type:complete len:109 (+),score=13.22 TRINITY_DN9413_c0_g1_i1:227-553(+)
MTTSCMLRERNVTLKEFKVNGHHLSGQRLYSREALINMLKGRPLVTHYVSPEVMYYLHAVKTDVDGEQLKEMEDNLFVNGCVKAFNQTLYKKRFDQCIESHRKKHKHT